MRPSVKRSVLLDSTHRFSTVDRELPTYRRRGVAIWMSVLLATALVFVALQAVGVRFTEDTKLYFLSTQAGVLGAVIALAAPLPLFFAAVSRYLSGCAAKLVDSWHFRGYVLLYTGTVVFALALMAVDRVHDLVLTSTFAVAAGCMLSLLPYFLWIRHRMDPRNHLDDLVSSADSRALASKDDHRADAVDANAYVKGQLDHVVAIGLEAVQTGSSVIFAHAISALVLFYIKHGRSLRTWRTNAALEALRNIVGAAGENAMVKVLGSWLLVRTVYAECVMGGLELPDEAAKELIALTVTPDTAGESVSVTRNHLRRTTYLLGVGAESLKQPKSAMYAAQAFVSLASEDVDAPADLPKSITRIADFASRWLLENYQEVDSKAALADFHNRVDLLVRSMMESAGAQPN